MNQERYSHVILMSLDTLRSDGINSCPIKLWPRDHHSSLQPQTSLLDQLAKNGAYFPNCISAAPYTAASHATFLTGKWPPRHGVHAVFGPPLQSRTVFNVGQRHGFRTIMKVDYPFILGHDLGFTSGVDAFLAEDDATCLEMLRRHPATFSLVHFGGMHVPYGFHNLKYGGEAYIRKVTEMEKQIPFSERSSRWIGQTSDMALSIRYRRVLEYLYARDDYDQLFEFYLEGIDRFMKTRFEPFMEQLFSILDGNRYLLIVFGDHGEEYDEESFGHQNSIAEGVLRVPLIFYGPGISSSIHLERVRSVDVAPTLFELLGIHDEVGACDGKSIAASVLDGTVSPARAAFAQAFGPPARADAGGGGSLIREQTAALQHTLHKEAVYDQGFRLTRDLVEYRKADQWRPVPIEPPRVRLARTEDGYTWIRHPLDVNTATRLTRVLTRYSRKDDPYRE